MLNIILVLYFMEINNKTRYGDMTYICALHIKVPPECRPLRDQGHFQIDHFQSDTQNAFSQQISVRRTNYSMFVNLKKKKKEKKKKQKKKKKKDDNAGDL